MTRAGSSIESIFAVLLAFPLFLSATDPAAAEPAAFHGLSLTTPFPALTVGAGEKPTLDVSVHNYGEPPQRLELAVDNLPDGWQAELVGDGRPVSAVLVEPDKAEELKLRLAPPEDAAPGTYELSLTGRSATDQVALPIAVTIGKVTPPQLGLTADLPALRGTPTSNFKYQLSISNDSGQEALVNLIADAPPGFQVTFKKAYGSQELTSIPVEAGRTQDVDVDIRLPQGVPAGQYEVTVLAAADGAQAVQKLLLDVTGRPELAIDTPDGRLSGRAEAGKSTPLKLVLRNDGTAEARDISLSASAPSQWEVTFSPESIDVLGAGETREVTATVVPAAKAIAGDYMMTVRARGDGVNDYADFRLTVETSTLWGAVGLVVIAASVVVLGFAVMRYGRR